ncbi:MAG: hypothetical protein R3246_15435 [Acidimicrobiia bacterium]|nr:hypothetical protein [Acidimicrobiia bacterium]
MWDEIGGPEWRALPVGRMFADRYPGYTCRDWPQHIPEVMAGDGDKCCWEEAASGDLGP